MVHFLKNNVEFSSKISVRDHKTKMLDRLCLNEIDKSVFQWKNPEKRVADSILNQIVVDQQIGGVVLQKLMNLWGKNRSFVQIASLRQQIYVTYMIYHIISRYGVTLYSEDNILDHLQTGVQYRISTGEIAVRTR